MELKICHGERAFMIVINLAKLTLSNSMTSEGQTFFHPGNVSF
jgi:hypothetical protein